MFTINPQYITDSDGKKISAILHLKELANIRLYDESKRDTDPAVFKSRAMEMLEAERKKSI